ncbi:hypothetical protein HRbin23_01314 [bacterium HR23]|nr:hypothetical protein HRbin23_01314 [bacterium HR23]
MYLGLDPATRSPWAWAILGDDRALLDAGRVGGRQDALALALRLRPVVVAVDAPLGLPQGMDCLEPNCPCRPTTGLAGRSCERELARRGVGLFFTTKRSLIKGMVYEATALRRDLEAHGLQVIEVYPYAVRRLLLGRKAPRKQRASARRALEDALTPLVPGVERLSPALGHDGQDAVLSALVGWLWHHGLTDALGQEEEGLLHVPPADFASRLLPGMRGCA